MVEGTMKKHFRGVLPFVAHRIQLNGSREEVIDDLKRRVTTFPLVRYNFFALGRPYQLMGQMGGDTFHFTASGKGWNGGQTVFHGNIRSVDERSCQMTYRIFPNNISLLFDLLAVCICVSFLFSTANKPEWFWMFIAFILLLGAALFLLSTTMIKECLNETLKEYLE